MLDQERMAVALEDILKGLFNVVSIGQPEPARFELTDKEKSVLSSLSVQELAYLVGIFARLGQQLLERAKDEQLFEKVW